MKIDPELQEIQTRLSRRQRRGMLIEITLWLSLGIGLAIIICIMNLPFWSALVAAIAIFLVGFGRLCRHRNKDTSNYSAARLLDRSLKSKDRALSYAWLKSQAKQEDSYKEEYLEVQLSKQVSNVSAAEIVPLNFSTVEKKSLVFIGILWILILSQFISSFTSTRFESVEAKAIQKILDDTPQLPDELRKDLSNLAEAFNESEPGSTEVMAALNEAEAELASAQSKLATSKESKSPKQPKDAAPSPQVSPTPTATPPADETKPQSEEKKESEQEKSAQDQKKDENEQSEQDSKQEQKDKTSKEQASSSGQKDKPDDQGQEGDGEGQGKSGQGQQGQGQQQSEASNQPGQNKEGKSESGEGQGKQEGQAQSGQGQGEGQKEGEQQDSQKQPGQSGQSEMAKALQQAQAVLDQVKKKADQGEQKSESGEKSQDSKGSESGENKSSSQEGNKPGSEKNKPGDKPQPEGKPNQPSPNQKPGEAPDGKESTNQNPKTEESDSKSPPTESLPKLSSLPKGSEEVKRFEEGEGDSGDKLAGRKGFKETEITGQDEKFDTRYTGQEGSLEKNTQAAEPKTKLEDLELAKPETSQSEDSQPIPLEYKDVLR